MHNWKFYRLLMLLGCALLGFTVGGHPPADASAIRGLPLREGEYIVFLSERLTLFEVYSMNRFGDVFLIAQGNYHNDLSAVSCSFDSRFLAYAEWGFISVQEYRTSATVTHSDYGMIRDIALSADGNLIAFSRFSDGTDISVVNRDGTNLTQLTYSQGIDTNPAWSPDGARIAFTSYRDGNAEIYVMNADGTNQVRLTNNVATDEYPTWSPDSSQIAFTSYRDDPLGGEIYVMNADGTNPVRITNHPGGNISPS